jgi:hypothetical protein
MDTPDMSSRDTFPNLPILMTPKFARMIVESSMCDFAYIGPVNFRRCFDVIAKDKNQESTDIVLTLFVHAIVGSDCCCTDAVPLRDILASLQETGTLWRINFKALVVALQTITNPQDIIALCEAIQKNDGVMGSQQIVEVFEKINLTDWSDSLKPEDARTLYDYFMESIYPPLKFRFLECAQTSTPFGLELAWILAEEEEALREPA